MQLPLALHCDVRVGLTGLLRLLPDIQQRVYRASSSDLPNLESSRIDLSSYST